jgi:1-phosphatidylinositol-3-phosphate 5-kinase
MHPTFWIDIGWLGRRKLIDFMRQYDILKQMERVGKSLPMVVGSEAPTVIQPPLSKARFTNAMERYFMTVPSKWTTL